METGEEQGFREPPPDRRRPTEGLRGPFAFGSSWSACEAAREDGEDG